MHVVAVGYAPVKGTRHTAHDTIELVPGGVVGDRDLCLVDVARRQVLRTVQNHALVAVHALRAGDVLRLHLPGGAVVEGSTPETGEVLECDYWGRPVALRLLGGPHAEALTAHLGRPVRLASAPRGGVVYGDAVSLVATASLSALATRLGRPPDQLEAARFRANVVLETHRAFAEEEWVGRELVLGVARLEVTGLVPRCAVTDLGPATGERDARVLRALVSLAAERGADGGDGPPFGLEAQVVSPGTVHTGDPVAVVATA